MMTFCQFTETIDWSKALPAEPGTTPIPDGHVRLYHQTTEKSAREIRKNGIKLSKARGIEGPRGIYADEQGFYTKPEDSPTVEFHVEKSRWDRPFVSGDVEPKNIIAVHMPWHKHARYIEQNKAVKDQVMRGDHDDMLHDKEYGTAIRLVKHTK